MGADAAVTAAPPAGWWTGQTSGERLTSAQPAEPMEPDEKSRRRTLAKECKVLVVDTGISQDLTVAGAEAGDGATAAQDLIGKVTVGGDVDPWDRDKNGLLDPAAGHGTFIAGLFANIAPGCQVFGDGVISSHGDTDDFAVAESLLGHFRECADDQPAYDIVSMSFGGFCDADDPPLALAHAIATIQHRFNGPPKADGSLMRDRVVFVASAGNDATYRPTWPASFENVIAVGALGPHGPASFTNYGPWVNACAPGVDVVSTFFDIGDEARHDNDHFDGWAKWSGTSFSAPIVAATIAWEWMSGTATTVRAMPLPGSSTDPVTSGSRVSGR